MSEETSDSESQDIQEHNETVRALSAGLLQIYEPKLKEVKENLKELINKQNDLQIAMTSEKNAFSSRQIQEVNEMMPLSATNFLFELDKTTQTIIDQIAAARKMGIDGPVEIPQAGMRADVPSNMSVAQLYRHRRQFLNYVKMHTNVLKTKAYKDKVARIKMQMHQIHQRTKNLRAKALEIQELKVNQCATKLQQLHYEESLVANSKRTPRKS